jgi:uncharacterized membrane protein YgdD (TMEM256/DUF423 family)
MARTIFTVAGVLGFLAVALGAFGAHGLAVHFATFDDAAKHAAWWDTAVDYHMWHTLLLLGLGALAGRVQSRSLAAASIATVVGIAVFSGTLYVMALTGIRWLGAITPIGGIALLVGWALATMAARQLARDVSVSGLGATSGREVRV